MHLHATGLIEQFLALGALALTILGSASWIKRAHRLKELEHAERIKALEMGLVPPPFGMNWPAAAVCIAMGAGVPIGSFGVAWLASLTAGAPDEIWFAPVVVSFPAIGAARKLAYRLIDPASAAKTMARARSAPAGKPVFDPDAFDVVGRRG